MVRDGVYERSQIAAALLLAHPPNFVSGRALVLEAPLVAEGRVRGGERLTPSTEPVEWGVDPRQDLVPWPLDVDAVQRAVLAIASSWMLSVSRV